MKKFLSIILAILMVVTMLPMAVLPASAASTPTPYDGVPVTPQKISSSNYAKLGLTSSNWSQFNGYYAIRNAKELYGFAAVSRSSSTANAVLLQDIVVNANGGTTYNWTPIAHQSNEHAYEGIFDGNGHYISGLYSTTAITRPGRNYSDCGFICNLYGTVKNLVIKNSTFAPGIDIGVNGGLGAITGYPYGCTIQNCRVENITLKSINDGGQLGGIAGYGNGGSSTIKNCVSINVTFSGGGVTNSIAPKAPYSSCYTSATASHNCTNLSVEHKEVKATCEYPGLSNYKYCLVCGKVTSGTKTETPATGHTLKSATCVAPKTCTICGATEGSIDNTAHNWANNDGICANGCGATCDHKNQTGSACEICGAELHVCSNYNNGFCTECDAYEPAELNENGYYEIGNAGQLFWYANYINTVDRTANAVLTADIDLENRPWTPIGSTGENSNNFRGIFDGQNYIIRGLYAEGGRAGLGFFGEVRTGTVKNFTIYGEVVVNTEVDYVGGVIGSICGVNGENDLERNGAIIQNIRSFVNLTVKAHGVGKIGGFVGYANHQSLIEKCSWYGTFDAGEYRVDSGAGGFIGKIQENSSEVTIRNCAAYGTIKTNYVGDYNDTATIYMGGFLSFSNTSAKTTLENCLFAGRFKRGENLTDQAFLGAFGTLRSVNAIKNCYYLGDDGLEAVHSDSPLKPGSDNIEITKVTGEELKSDMVAAMLGEYWEQGVHYPTLKDHGSHWGSETYSYTDNGNGTHDMVCTGCGYVEVYNEAHTMDITTGKCGICDTDMTVIATVTDGTNTYYAADADILNEAVTVILETGSRTFTVELPADTEAEMITAIRRAICDTEGVADGSINLTLKGVTSIPGTTNWDGVAFGPGDIYDEAGEIVDQELVTQLASINLPDATEIGAQAFYFCENLVSVSAPKAQTIGMSAFGYTALTSVEFPELTTIPTDMFSGTWTLSSAKFPKVTTIEQNGLLIGAKFKPENNPTPFPLELTAEGDITFNGSNHFNSASQNYSGKVDLVLNIDKKDQVTFNDDGTATWQVRDDLSYTFKSITFTCTDGTTNHSYTYTDNGDGTHDATCSACGAVVDNEVHTIENHVCIGCGAKEIVVSFNAGDYEWKTGDQINFVREVEGIGIDDCVFTATVAEDGTVTWTADKPFCWYGEGEQKLFAAPNNGWSVDYFVIPEDQSTSAKLDEADLVNGMWVGTPTTDTVTFNMTHRMAKVTVNYEFAEGVTADISELKVYSIAQICLFSLDDWSIKLTSAGQLDVWVTPYLDGNQFTAFIIPETYATGEDFIKITLSDGTVYEVKMNKAVTFEDGGEYNYKVVITADGAYLTCADECTFEYTDNEDGLTHSKVCTECGYVAASEAHSGGTATCTKQAECQRCGASYGEVDRTNHSGALGDPVPTEDGKQHIATYDCCDTEVTEEHDFENDAHQCVCGKMETFTVSWFLSGSLMQSTSTYGQEFTQTFTVPENTHLRIDSVYLANDASVPVNYTYENGVLTIAATDVPAADVYIDCDHNVLVTFHANGGEIIPEDGYPQEGSTDIFPEDGSYWTQEWNYGLEICLSNCAAVCREGYTFVDWRDASGQVHQVIPGNGNYTLATEDMTLYAQWQCNHTIGGVVFRDNGNGTHNGYCGECDELLGNYVEHPHNFGDNTYKCVCGYACPHDSYTDGVCDNCGYECPHEWGEGVLTRPTFESEGYYTYTCTLCCHSYTEPTEKADDTALNDASMKVTEYIDNDTLTQEAKDEIYKSYRDILKDNGNLFDEFGFVRNDLVEEDQPAIDAITEELQKIIDEAEEKIASGEYAKADYTEIDEAIDDIEEKLASENVTDEGKAELEEIKKQLEEMKADENTSAADVAELEKALEDYEEELDKGIEDGTLVEVDGDAIADDVNKKWAEKLEADGLLDEYEDFINNQKATDEAMATVDEINDFANSLEGTVAENAENIAKLNEMLDSLLESWENCLRGTHNFKDYEITSPAKCEVNAKETSTCWFCGETDEREVEGTALEHIFLDYASNGDATCTADGTKTAFCIHGCGATDTVADEGSMIDHTDEDGDKLCDDCGEEVYDRCDICGGKAHGDDKIQLLFCMIITIIRFVTAILKSIN